MNPKILIFIDWYLPGTNSGGPVRSYYNMITQLGHKIDFYIITRNIDYCSENVYESVNSNVWNDSYNNSKVLYLSNLSIKNLNYLCFVEEINPNTILINGMYSLFFSILPLIKFKNKFPVIISTRGMLSPQGFSAKKFKKLAFLSLFSIFNFYKNVTFHATNDSEKENIIKILGDDVIVKVASNFSQKIHHDIVFNKKNKPTRFLNLARISIEKGTLIMLKSFEEIKSDVVIDICGTIYDIDYWQECKKVIEKLPDNIIVNYKGLLSFHEIDIHLLNYDFMIMLSNGENFGHSILESFSAGLPVLISDNTPWVDLEEKNIGWDINLKNENITDIINKACSINEADYYLMSKNCFNFAKIICNDELIIKTNLDLLNL